MQIQANPHATIYSPGASNLGNDWAGGLVTELVGKLVSLNIFNDNWGIGIVQTDDLKNISVNGSALTGLQKGLRYQFNGKSGVHSKYGQQFIVYGAMVDIPQSPNAIVKHIQKHLMALVKKRLKSLFLCTLLPAL